MIESKYTIKHHEKRAWHGRKIKGFGVFIKTNGKDKLISDLFETPHEARAELEAIINGDSE